MTDHDQPEVVELPMWQPQESFQFWDGRNLAALAESLEGPARDLLIGQYRMPNRAAVVMGLLEALAEIGTGAEKNGEDFGDDLTTWTTRVIR
jgi:hypothetical protein